MHGIKDISEGLFLWFYLRRYEFVGEFVVTNHLINVAITLDQIYFYLLDTKRQTVRKILKATLVCTTFFNISRISLSKCEKRKFRDVS